MVEKIKINDPLKQAIRQTINAWNNAEREIKSAEMNNNEIVLPAIFEMRYAGRRITEALDALSKDDLDSNEPISHLNEAEQYLIRARHDAIDALTSSISMKVDMSIKKYGIKRIKKYISNFPEKVNTLYDIKNMIAESRSSRNSRNKIYDEIGANKLIDIIDFSKEIQLSGLELEELKHLNRSNRHLQIGLAGIIAAIGALLGALVSLFSL